MTNLKIEAFELKFKPKWFYHLQTFLFDTFKHPLNLQNIDITYKLMQPALHQLHTPRLGDS